MDKDEVISVLNNLIETCKDGKQGFCTSANGVKNPSLQTFLETVAQSCAEGAHELQAKVKQLGGDPEQSGSVAGTLHRGWVNIKSTITGMDDAAILAECERGEDSAKHAYEEALAQDLPPDLRSLIEKQFGVVKQNHDRVRQMRNAAA